MIKVSAPGKIHLSGEHSVVYGRPACLAAINRHCFVSLKKRNDEKIEIKDKVLKVKEKLTFSQIRHFAFLTPKVWQSKDPLALVKIGINEIYGNLQKKPELGFNLEIYSQIPIGFGLGSSAALAVALTAVILILETKKLDKNLINQISFKIEKYQHGNPSGGDNTVSTFGGLVKFQKKDNKFQFSQLKFSKSQLPEFLLVDSGKPIESTGEMVEEVRAKLKSKNLKQQLKTKNLIKKIGKITDLFISCFEKEQFDNFSNLMKNNERLLEKLGVVGKRAKKLIQLIKQAGGAGKICGAGGIKKGSGMILAYNVKINKIIEFLKIKNLKFIKIKLGEKGVKKSK